MKNTLDKTNVRNVRNKFERDAISATEQLAHADDNESQNPERASVITP